MSKNKPRPEKYLLYLDESGVAHGTEKGSFTLAGIIIKKKYADELKIKLDAFKTECFGKSDIILHMMDIRTNKKDFSPSLIHRNQIQSFEDNLPAFLESLDITIISATVDNARLHEYYKTPKDEYSIAFMHIMKNIYHFICEDTVDQLDIFLETRDETNDFTVQKSFFESYYNGSIHLDITEAVKSKIKRFVFKDKKENIAGLQIIDAICMPIKAIRTHGTDGSTNQNDVAIFNAIKSKFYNPLQYNDIKNWSFKKVPLIKKPGTWIESKK